MRSRFTAYAVGAVDHIIATTHPTSPHQVTDLVRWRIDIHAFAHRTRFVSLTIHDSGEDAQQGWVRFTAGLEAGGEAQPMHEHSIFYRLGQRWLYHSAASP